MASPLPTSYISLKVCDTHLRLWLMYNSRNSLFLSRSALCSINTFSWATAFARTISPRSFFSVLRLVNLCLLYTERIYTVYSTQCCLQEGLEFLICGMFWRHKKREAWKRVSIASLEWMEGGSTETVGGIIIKAVKDNFLYILSGWILLD